MRLRFFFGFFLTVARRSGPRMPAFDMPCTVIGWFQPGEGSTQKARAVVVVRTPTPQAPIIVKLLKTGGADGNKTTAATWTSAS